MVQIASYFPFDIDHRREELLSTANLLKRAGWAISASMSQKANRHRQGNLRDQNCSKRLLHYALTSSRAKLLSSSTMHSTCLNNQHGGYLNDLMLATLASDQEGTLER